MIMIISRPRKGKEKDDENHSTLSKVYSRSGHHLLWEKDVPGKLAVERRGKGGREEEEHAKYNSIFLGVSVILVT
jgi:hypothetical protein